MLGKGVDLCKKLISINLLITGFWKSSLQFAFAALEEILYMFSHLTHQRRLLVNIAALCLSRLVS